jgi:hypothetical protein
MDPYSGSLEALERVELHIKALSLSMKSRFSFTLEKPMDLLFKKKG